jgi:hypothetical protein
MEEEAKIRIGGIKFSEELIQVRVALKSPADSSIKQLLHLIAEKHINIPFLCHSVVSKSPETVFCVERSEMPRIQQILDHSPHRKEHVNIIESVGTLTLFPHKNECKFLGLIFDFFGRNRFPVHALSTSISAIAINTDFHLLDNIAEKLQNIIELPDNHAPFRQEFRVTQIQIVT